MPRTPRRRGKIAGVSLDDPEAVDSVGTLRDGSAVVLTIEDDRDWADEPAHLAALRAKLDAYLALAGSVAASPSLD
jgi:hypothetical protein